MLKSALINVACSGCGGHAKIQGFTHPEAPGLAINLMHVHGSRGQLLHVDAWVVTHLDSGLVVRAGYRRRDQAEYALVLLGEIAVDWTLPYDRLQAPELRALIGFAVESASGLDAGLAEL